MLSAELRSAFTGKTTGREQGDEATDPDAVGEVSGASHGTCWVGTHQVGTGGGACGQGSSGELVAAAGSGT